MSQIQVKNLSFSYPGSYNYVFKDVSFNIDTTWKLGLIGRNGKGKTTFLNLLLDKYEYGGTINKTVNFDYFPFEVKDENLYAIDVIKEINPYIEDWQIFKELNLINADIEILYREFSKLSGGEKVKILLVALFLKENEFLLIDEPTNHLDTETKIEVANYLNKKSGFIVVSHDRNLLDNVVDHIISINNTNIEIQSGNYSSWKENKDRQDNFEINTNEKLQKDISRLEQSAKQASKWSNEVEKTKLNTRNSGLRPDRGYIGHQAAKMMQRSKSLENRKNKEIEEKKQLLKNIDFVDDLVIKPEKTAKKDMIFAKNLQIKYNDKFLFDKLDFSINTGDRAVLIGKNGCGKTSLLKLLLGENISYDGIFKVSNNIKISYVSQDTSHLKGTLKQYTIDCNVDEAIFKAMLFKMGVSKNEFDTDLSNMSEGQKKKVLIARSISETADIYIWDEPLNYIDIQSREQIENMILKYKPTMFFVEHDEMFMEKIATKKIKMNLGTC